MRTIIALLLFNFSLSLFGQQVPLSSKILRYRGQISGHPQITLASPSPNSEEYTYQSGRYITTTTEIVVKGTVMDDDGIDKFTINGKKVDLEDGHSFEYTRKLEIDDLMDIRISAIDKEGKSSSVDLFFKRKKDEKRLALVIGNGEYVHHAPLKNALNDAELMTRTLEKLDFTVLKHLNLTLEGMRKAVLAFARKAEAADVAWIYFAGHGFQQEGINFLVPIDADADVGKFSKHQSYLASTLTEIFEIITRLV